MFRLCLRNSSPWQRLASIKAISVNESDFQLNYLISYDFPNDFKVAYMIFGVVGGPILGIFTLGIFFPWANAIVNMALIFRVIHIFNQAANTFTGGWNRNFE